MSKNKVTTPHGFDPDWQSYNCNERNFKSFSSVINDLKKTAKLSITKLANITLLDEQRVKRILSGKNSRGYAYQVRDIDIFALSIAFELSVEEMHILMRLAKPQYGLALEMIEHGYSAEKYYDELYKYGLDTI